MHNFRRGRDWAADPTGNTILPNHCFIDGLEGDDSNTGLDPNLPLKTLTQAKILHPTSVFKITAPWAYIDQLGSVGALETHVIIGDSTDEDVVFIDSQSNRGGLGVDNCENVTLVNYLTGCSNVRAINCTFQDCSSLYINRLIGCRLINCSPSNAPSGGTGGHFCYSSAFINSPLTLLHPNPAVQINILGCYFDGSSTLNNTTPNVLNLTSCHFENKISWDIASVNYGASNTDGDAFIFDSGLLNYTFDKALSPLFGRGYPDGFSNPRHMARYYIGAGFYSGTPSFDAKILANNNLNVLNDEIIVIGPNDSETIETDEVVINNVIGVPHKVGILNYTSTLFGLNPSSGQLERVLELRWTNSDNEDINTKTYKKFRFGEQATVNSDGKGNGDTGYTWSENIPIKAYSFQARINIVKAGVV